MKELNVVNLIDMAVQEQSDESKVFDYMLIAKYCMDEARKLYTRNPSSDGQIFTNMCLHDEMQDVKRIASLYLITHKEKYPESEESS